MAKAKIETKRLYLTLSTYTKSGLSKKGTPVAATQIHTMSTSIYLEFATDERASEFLDVQQFVQDEVVMHRPQPNPAALYSVQSSMVQSNQYISSKLLSFLLSSYVSH